MFSIFEKYKALILYGIFGVTTTIINVVSYALMLLSGINVQVAVVVRSEEHTSEHQSHTTI